MVFIPHLLNAERRGEMMFLPDDQPFPTRFNPKQIFPCPACRAMWIVPLSRRALEFRGFDPPGVANLVCRICQRHSTLLVGAREGQGSA
jgi:hypothetical protein